MNLILIYSIKITNRLEYIFDLIFKEILGINLRFTTDEEVFRDFNGAKLNYGKQKQENELFCYAENILFEKNQKAFDIEVGEFRNIKCIFYHNHKDSVLPFDPFAAAFYLVTRYEEYLEFNADRYGRFNSDQSISFKYGFLKKPVVNIWAYWLAAILRDRYPNLVTEERKFKFIPTYDIDIAYSYKYKGFIRNLGAFLNELRNFNFKGISKRAKVLFGSKKDPYDTYGFQIELQKKYNLSPIYFFLLGQFSTLDRNISSDTPAYQHLMQSIADYAKVGIHPSFKSYQNPDLVIKEIKLLSRLIKRDITHSRQHYILLHFPQIYQQLLKNEIRREFSMGYPDRIGFRAGIASSYLFYDLSIETKTPMRIFPFCIMDVTLKDYLQLDTKKALKECLDMLEEVKKVNGLFITIFHNHTLSETDGWEGWSLLYEQLVQKATRR